MRPIARDSARSPICAAAGSRRSAARSPTTCCSRPSATRLVPVSYDDDVHPYTDLLVGRVDAVLLDNVLAAAVDGADPGLFTQPDGRRDRLTTSSSLAPGEPRAARSHRRHAARSAMRGRPARGDLPEVGSLERRSAAAVCASSARQKRRRAHGTRPQAEPRTTPHAAASALDTTRRYLPALLRAAWITLVLSCSGDGARGRLGMLHGDRPRLRRPRGSRRLLTAYVEVMRGTPVLLQLFVIYYGLASVSSGCRRSSPPLIGLGLNYAAYESEIYRSALEAVPRGQLEAARIARLHRAPDPPPRSAGRRRSASRWRR